MDQYSFTVIICLAGLFGIIFGMALIAYEDGVPFGLYKRIRCKLGLHKQDNYKIKKYYCQYCKKPRKHPDLKVIDGGNKMRDNKYRF